jgi:hypothetical protein
MQLESNQWIRIVICAIFFTPLVGAIVWAVYQYEAIQKIPKVGLQADISQNKD